MSGPFGSSQWMYNSGGGFYDYSIDDSLRFNDDDSAYLSRSFASAGNRKTWTFSAWIKLSSLSQGERNTFFGPAGGEYGGVTIYQDSGLRFAHAWDPAGTDYVRETVGLFRDPSAWYHVVWWCDTTQAGTRWKIYVNGTEQTLQTPSGNNGEPAQNTDLPINSANTHYLGGNSVYGYFDGYMAEVNFIDGTALDPTSFGETKSGVWIPKAYSGSYGANGFHLEFAGNPNDSSGNSNNFTANNISSHDYMPDSPTNNFPTINATFPHASMTFKEGNLRHETATNNRGVVGNFLLPKSGKWYWEHWSKSFNYPTDNEMHAVGINVPTVDIDASRGGWDTGVTLSSATGDKNVEGSTSSYGSGWAENQGCAVLFDADAGTISWSENGGAFGSAVSIPSGTDVDWIPFVGMGGGFSNEVGFFNFGQDGTFAGETTSGNYTDANGIGNFKWEPPADALALCTANFPAPAIDPLEDETPEDYFNTVLYTGNGTTNNVDGVGFQPDFGWFKSRSNATSHELHDVIRGIGRLSTNTTTAESTILNGFVDFDTDGYDLDGAGGGGEVNTSGRTYVVWSWKAGGSASSNTDGSITSTVSANQDAGFSVATYTGDGSGTANFGHGLSAKPEMIIIKNRTGTVYDWKVFHHKLSTIGYILKLNSTAGEVNTGNTTFGGPTSSLVVVKNNGTAANATNISGVDYVAYCFHSVDGYSKAGSYTGNGSSDGPFVYTGFRPAFLLIKRSSPAGANWEMIDTARGPYNPNIAELYANQSSAEFVNSSQAVDINSNGLKIKTTDGGYNYSGGTYIYMAFAEQPFKYANAR
jgi:hypothetical protein